MSDWLSALPFVSQPAFYAVAVPAVLMMGLAKSGFLSGFGSLAVPLMALTIPVPQAAAIMLPLLFVMDLAGLQQLWRERDRELIRLLLPAGLIGTVVGTVLFGVLSAKTVAAVVGGLTLLFLAQRLLFPPKVNAPPPPKPLGFMLAIASGFTSFVAHAGSPPISAYVLPLRLPNGIPALQQCGPLRLRPVRQRPRKRMGVGEIPIDERKNRLVERRGRRGRGQHRFPGRAVVGGHIRRDIPEPG